MLENAEATLAMAENIRKPFQSLEREPVDLNLCITCVLKEQEETLENIVVLKDLDQDLPLVLATQQLQLVFENLLNNALQAMKQCPTVKDVLRFSTRLSNDGQWVEIIVQDSGPGLSDLVNEIDIFKLGVTGREGGMGYGLWWCDTFLKRWGGDIQLLENTKNGCKFLVRLPTVSSAMKMNP
jgi:signal transduction histidine kinase